MSARAPTLIAVGDNCLDVYLNKGVLAVGGNALNVAVQWHRAGWSARYFGAVGDDAEGAILLEEIATAGLSPGDVEQCEGETAVTLLHDEAGDRQFLLESFGVGEHYMPSADRYTALAQADWVHLGTNANSDLVRALHDDKIPFSIDVSTTHSALPLAGVPLVFASGPDSESEPVQPVLKGLRDAGADRIVLTCGPRGAFFDDGREVLHVPAVPVAVVDTCGAGDSFIAAFLTASRFEGLEPADALRKAARAAALTCTYRGGFPQQLRRIPSWLPAKYARHINRKQGA
jgi:fructoselysine 6-kinase